MRRSLLAAALALALLVRLAAAQDGPPAADGDRPAGAPAAERVLMDLTFWTVPGPVAETCVELPAGRLGVTVRLQGERTRPAATYLFGPARQREPDPDAEIRMTATSEPTAATVPLAGGRYCYAILNHTDAPGRPGSEPVGQSQQVAVKMVLTPR